MYGVVWNEVRVLRFAVEMITHHFSYHNLACGKHNANLCFWHDVYHGAITQLRAASLGRDVSRNLKRRAEHLTFPFDGG